VQSHRIELDFFSGLQNPSFEITKEDFVTLYKEVMKLEKSSSLSLFDGLGFRGVILSEGNTLLITVQNKVIEVELHSEKVRFRSNPSIALKAIGLFKKYDREGKYSSLIESAMAEYHLN
jgi:hypothetical protein